MRLLAIGASWPPSEWKEGRPAPSSWSQLPQVAPPGETNHA